MFKILLFLWHTSRLKYHRVLIKGCQDEQMREKIIKMLEFHSAKINELNKKNSLAQE